MKTTKSIEASIFSDISRYNITFMPEDFRPSSLEVASAKSVLTCVGCVDELETQWKFVDADDTEYIVDGTYVYEALITRMTRINMERASVENDHRV